MTPSAKTLRFDPVKIGSRIRAARRKRGLSTEKLAQRTGIGAESLYKKERGTQPFYFEELSRVCEALETPTLFPFVDWDTAKLLDKELGR